MYGAKIEVELGGFSAVIREEALVRQVEQIQWLTTKWSKEEGPAASTRQGCAALIICVEEWKWSDDAPEGFQWPDLPRDISADDPCVMTRFESLRNFISFKAFTKVSDAVAASISLPAAVEGNSGA